jgi:hypothetical protein
LFSGQPNFHGQLTYAFFACWLVGVAAYIAGRVVANRFLTLSQTPLPAEPSEPQWAAFVRARAEGLEGWSAALPLAAMSLLMPLTLWYFFALFWTTVSQEGTIASSFDQVISISVFLAGIAHLTLALYSVRFGLKLATRETPDLMTIGPSSWISALIAATLGGTIPGAAYYLLPTMLIAMTGFYFIPFMLTLMAKRIALERGDLA